MKAKTLIITIVVTSIFLSTVCVSNAQSTTPTDKPTPKPTATNSIEEKLEKNAQILKDKIATTVAEMTEKAGTVVSGLIKSVDKNEIIIVDDKKNQTHISTDELVTIYKQARLKGTEELKREDLAANDYIVVSGTNIESEISANKIYRQKQYLVGSGQITGTNPDNFQIDIATVEKDQYTLDIEKTTVNQIMNTKTLELAKAGFSKLKVGDNVAFVIERPSPQKKKSVAAIRILIIPQEYFTKAKS